MKAIDRFYQYLAEKGIKATRFEKDAGLSNGYLGTQKKRNADLGEGVILKIIDNCRDLSLQWLLTGKGPMLYEQEVEPPPRIMDEYSLKLIHKIEIQAEQIGRLKERLEKYEK
ncbi:hypothetical protein [Alistipes shahii]|uniref:hypothetical protein n=1 Tax=Alistipes shahii TaxID=328814 RepID=UPI0034A31ECC